jgi:hypothetical protein
MKIRFAAALLVVSALLGGCATKPQSSVPLSSELLSSKSAKIGVAMTALPKVDTAFPGAGCLLCMAAASLANQSLTAHFQTLPQDDLARLKADMVKALRAKGLDASAIDEPLDLKNLPSLSSSQPNFATKDFSSLKAKYKIDKLLVIEITSLGATRNYSAYIPTSDPKAVVSGTGYIVNLSSNALEWVKYVNIQKSADQKWDEPPKFPGLTNAYFQAIELSRDGFTKPFEQ